MHNIRDERRGLIACAVLTLLLAACGGGAPAISPSVVPSGSPTSAPSGLPSSSPSGTPSGSPSSSPPPPSPTPTGAAGSAPLTIVDSDTATIPAKNINVYITGVNAAGTEPMYADRYGNETVMAAGATAVPIPWFGTGNSEVLYLPPALSARVYIVDGTISNLLVATAPPNQGVSSPSPWKPDASQNIYFDDIEYSFTNGNVNFDTSQTDALGLDLTIQTSGFGALSPNNTTVGFGSGGMAALTSAIRALPTPWPKLANEAPYHIINPQHGAPTFFKTADFLLNQIMEAWKAYTGNWMEITASSLSATNYPGALYGTVDSSGNFDFYTAQSTSPPSTLVGSIESPFTYFLTNGEPVTTQMLGQNGTFNDFMQPYSALAQTYPTLGPAVGNRLSGALNSGVMIISPSPPPNSGTLITTQPICTGRFPGPSPAPYENQYAAAIHQVSNTYGNPRGAAYGYPYDDLCNTSTDTTQYGLTQMTITINP